MKALLGTSCVEGGWLKKLVKPISELALHTRLENPISNRLDRRAAAVGLNAAVADCVKRYPSALHRRVGPCASFNCHGLTFGSRRTWIDGSNQIDGILSDDEYSVVANKDVLPGDIAIYKQAGQIEHSGIVVQIVDGLVKQPKILSKWGNLHEVVHLPRDCPYSDMTITYHRITS